LTSSAEKELKKLPGQWIARIVPRLENLASNPRPPGCKKLRGGNREWRFRVGDYRVVYTIDDEARFTNDDGLASGFQKPLETLADLLMGEVFAAFESVFAALHGLDKAGFLLEIARQHILHQVVGIPALLGGRVRELRFQFPGDMHFHFVGSSSENTLLRYHVGS